jgi:hypothetical protein
MRRWESFCTVLVLAVVIGRITDRTTGQPLPGVTVSLNGVRTTSGADGTYRLTGVKPGHGVLSISSHDVPVQHFAVTVGTATSRQDLRACSVTLDYSCGAPALPGGG